MNKSIEEMLKEFSVIDVLNTSHRGMLSTVIYEPRYRSPDYLRSATTFLLGHHPRVGRSSPLIEFPPDVLVAIVSMACRFGAVTHVNIVHPLVAEYGREGILGDVLDFQFLTYPGLRNAFSKRMTILGMYTIHHYLKNAHSPSFCRYSYLKCDRSGAPLAKNPRRPSDNVATCAREAAKIVRRLSLYGSQVFTQLFLAAIDVTGTVLVPLVHITEITVALYAQKRPLSYQTEYDPVFRKTYNVGDVDPTYPLVGIIAFLLDGIKIEEGTRRLALVNKTIDTMLVSMRGYQRIESTYRSCRGKLWSDPPERENHAADIERIGKYVERKTGMSAEDHDKRAHVIKNAIDSYETRLDKIATAHGFKRNHDAFETKPPVEKRRKFW
jgi:hypothetical protein